MGRRIMGHAYTTIACRRAGAVEAARRVRCAVFLTGTDEHGQKVEKAAADAGLAPQAFVDGISAQFEAMTRRMGVSHDAFIRTTEPRHLASCAALWQRVQDAGDIYLGGYEGWYAVRDEAFYGADELVDGPAGKLAPTGAPVEWVTEPSYFFRLSQWQERLLAFYDAHPDFLGPSSTRREVLSFVRGGLDDLSISRTSFKWGVPVPGDDAHVMYVWFDALTNYITALGYPDTDGDLWRFWPADLHLVGKEIARFHCVFWPAFLMSAGLAPPARVFANGWLTIEGEKMSKSIGNVIDPMALADEVGLDAVRFYLMREVPFGNDGNYSRKALIGRMNVELANDLGNLAQRTLSFVAKNAGGVVPEPGTETDEDAALRAMAAALPAAMGAMLDRQAIGEAIEEGWRVIRAGNAYVDRQAPWALRKTDPARMTAVLRVLLDVLRTVATVLQPVMPASMGRMLDQLGVPEGARMLADLAVPLAAGTALPPPAGVFPRFVEAA